MSTLRTPVLCLLAALLLAAPASAYAQDLGVGGSVDVDVGADVGAGVDVDAEADVDNGVDVGVDVGETGTGTDAGIDVDSPIGVGVAAPDPQAPAGATGNEQELALDAVRSARALPLDQILAAARRHTSGEIIDARLIELRGFLLYELKVIEAGGDVADLYFYARSGEIVRVE